MLEWRWRKFEELSNQELYDILALRLSVFSVEQRCAYQDLDYRDQQCQHLMGIYDNKLAAYLRLLPENLPYTGAISLGRVVTAPFARKQGLGKQLLQQALLYLEEIGNTLPIIISAQLYLAQFYQAFGFVTKSQPYDEDGILHIKMQRG